MDVVEGVDGLRPGHGPIFAVIGVFDGLHLGHAYLLEHLTREAAVRHARPAVITFDHHPDEVLTGSAPPLLLDPAERLQRLADAGVGVVVIQPFDDTVRQTPYDAFVDGIRARTALAGLLMTPDAAFGYERRGTADAVGELARDRGFELVVVPPYMLDSKPVSSTSIRTAIAAGDLAAAERSLGRPVGFRGRAEHGRVPFDLPMAMPPDGAYRCTLDGRPATAIVDGQTLRIEAAVDGPVDVRFLA